MPLLRGICYCGARGWPCILLCCAASLPSNATQPSTAGCIASCLRCAVAAPRRPALLECETCRAACVCCCGKVGGQVRCDVLQVLLLFSARLDHSVHLSITRSAASVVVSFWSAFESCVVSSTTHVLTHPTGHDGVVPRDTSKGVLHPRAYTIPSYTGRVAEGGRAAAQHLGDCSLFPLNACADLPQLLLNCPHCDLSAQSTFHGWSPQG